MRSLLLLIALGAVLAGCDDSGDGDLNRWMAQQRSQIRPKVDELPAPKTFTPQAYTQEAATDPFVRDKFTQALRRESGQANNNAALLAPEMARRKEPLESFPLDTMAMVGTLFKQGKPVALVKVDNLLYQVRLGQYLGQNYGKVTKVDESEVVLREIVQDPSGEWVERAATLQLQERAK